MQPQVGEAVDEPLRGDAEVGRARHPTERGRLLDHDRQRRGGHADVQARPGQPSVHRGCQAGPDPGHELRADLVLQRRQRRLAGRRTGPDLADVPVGVGQGYEPSDHSVDVDPDVSPGPAPIGQHIEADGSWTGGDVRADVHRVIAGFVALADADRDIREIWASAAPSEPALAALKDEVRAQFVTRIRTSLTAAVDAGLARPSLDVGVAATALAVMVEQSTALGGVSGTPDFRVTPQRLVDGLADLWLHAVYAPLQTG